MTVRELIQQLLNTPLDSMVSMVSVDDGNYVYKNAFCVVDYEDGSVGVLSKEEM